MPLLAASRNSINLPPAASNVRRVVCLSLCVNVNLFPFLRSPFSVTQTTAILEGFVTLTQKVLKVLRV